MSLKWFLNVSHKFWFIRLPKNGYLQCVRLCLLFFFQISSKLNLFSCRDGVYSLSMILTVCFDVKKALWKFMWHAFAVFSMKTLHWKKNHAYFRFENIAFQKSFIPNLDSLTCVLVFESVMFVNVSLAMFLKCFLRFRHFEPHIS